MAHALEMGHVFKLGTRYSDSFDFCYLNEKGERQKVVMGCYGIGVNRILAAAIEQHHDDKGIQWPFAIAPYLIDLIVVNTTDEESKKVADKLYLELSTHGYDVIYDERDQRAGVKFNDAELIGFPIQIILGERNLKQGLVEVKDRKSMQINKIEISNLIDYLASILKPISVDN
jgi:prolyl-tRNA synthetase